MASSVFECGNPDCDYAIGTEGMNGVQLKVLRRIAQLCKKCGKRTQWYEQTSLFALENQNNNKDGGTRNARSSKIYREHDH